MSIIKQADYWCRKGELARLLPMMPTTATPRTMFISTDIQNTINGAGGNRSDQSRGGMLRADLERFIVGDSIAFPRVRGRNKRSYLVLLDPPADGIWEVRSLNPSPSIRVLGAFAVPDVFVALVVGERQALGARGSTQWRNTITACKAKWRQLFSPYQPLVRSHDIADYITTGIVYI